ncbi:GIY-YIG nuclease family protein [Methylococcus sp. ANG]|uniref:GIY-YIG nuclease family protein n=1 Tax=Methylococcus sp. ANG TaxID=3231903 RepID=UPI00345ADD23
MDIKEALKSLISFVETNQELIGPISLSRYKSPIDACNFHLEYKALSQELGNQDGRVEGIYLYYSKDDDVILYVGISNDIYTRFLRHIGRGFSFGEKCSFPNFDLIEMYQGWCSDEAKQILRSGAFFVEAIRVHPFEAARLLESFIIYRGFFKGSKPELNVTF